MEGRKKKKPKQRAVSKLLLKMLCWGKTQELSLFIVLLFGKILVAREVYVYRLKENTTLLKFLATLSAKT